MTPEDRAWLAGFIEGEGNVVRTRLASGRIQANGFHITQVNPQPLVKAHALCGGRVLTKREPKHPGENRCLVLAVYGPKARRVVREIYPILSPKRREQFAGLLEDPPPYERTPEHRANLSALATERNRDRIRGEDGRWQ
jgi:hypothetical protein